MKNIHHHKTSPVEQNDVSTDDYMLAIGRRRREAALQVVRTAYDLRPESRRQSSAYNQLAFQSGRKPVAFGQARGQMITVLVIPAAYLVTVMVRVAVATVAFVMAPAVVLVIIVTVVAIVLVVPMSVALGHGESR